MSALERSTERVKAFAKKKANLSCFLCGSKVRPSLAARARARARALHTPLTPPPPPRRPQGANYAVTKASEHGFEVGVFMCPVCSGLVCVGGRALRARARARAPRSAPLTPRAPPPSAAATSASA